MDVEVGAEQRIDVDEVLGEGTGARTIFGHVTSLSENPDVGRLVSDKWRRAGVPSPKGGDAGPPRALAGPSGPNPSAS
ncbi:hypothetical protein GCM10023166_11550 [Paeniglutamicibacter cryotolerans]